MAGATVMDLLYTVFYRASTGGSILSLTTNDHEEARRRAMSLVQRPGVVEAWVNDSFTARVRYRFTR